MSKNINNGDEKRSSPEFAQAMRSLLAAHDGFVAGTLNPRQHGERRERALTACLKAMAGDLGVILRGPMHIDSRGEYELVAIKEVIPPGRFERAQQGQFGDEFSAALNAVGTRRGHIAYGYDSHLQPENHWCMINHFAAEKMVKAYAATHHPSDKVMPEKYRWEGDKRCLKVVRVADGAESILRGGVAAGYLAELESSADDGTRNYVLDQLAPYFVVPEKYRWDSEKDWVGITRIADEASLLLQGEAADRFLGEIGRIRDAAAQNHYISQYDASFELAAAPVASPARPRG